MMKHEGVKECLAGLGLSGARRSPDDGETTGGCLEDGCVLAVVQPVSVRARWAMASATGTGRTSL